jgi:hypothetical protein
MVGQYLQKKGRNLPFASVLKKQNFLQLNKARGWGRCQKSQIQITKFSSILYFHVVVPINVLSSDK